MKGRRQAGAILIVIGIAAAVLGASLLFYGIYRNTINDQSDQNTLVSLRALIPDRTQGTIEKDTQEDGEMPVVVVAGNSFVGILELESLESEWPVAIAQSEGNYPFVSKGTAQYGTLVITGTNYQDLFGKLRDLKEGDPVRFTDVRGDEYDYTVTSISEAKGRPVPITISS